jgi:hypothetical protein
MKVLGDWNWYLPSWLEWIPQVGSEDAAVPPTEPREPSGPREPEAAEEPPRRAPARA